MSSRLFPAVLILLLAGACASARVTRTQPIVVGPTTDRDPERLFAAAFAAVQQAGYVAREVDFIRGEYRVLARAQGHRGLPVFMIVQVYRDGWVRVIPAGPGARRDHTHVILPPAVVAEHTRLGAELTTALVSTGAPQDEQEATR